MRMNTFRNYFINCFLLIIPILIWNIGLITKLPEAFQEGIFWRNIPSFLTYGENGSRLIMILLTLLMPLRISTRTQKIGLFLYLGGLTLYFISWLALIYLPDSEWSMSLSGFLAPAYTPFFWLMGIGLIGDSFYVNLPYSRFYFMLVSILFLLFHNLHTITIYYRTH